MNNYIQDFEDFISKWLSKKPFGYGFQESANYLLNNHGKYLRPSLVLSVAQDLKQMKESHYWLALSLELHHNYTLIHDDLPCMDNDDFRRGKPTIHKVFGEAHALLLGDIFLAKSFELLGNIDIKNLPVLIKIFSFATGAKGLILGQKIDLESDKSRMSDSEILRMYELKTARLFQLAMLSSVMLTTESVNTKLLNLVLRIGSVSGILFQLIDDYEDWHSDKKSDFNFFKYNEIAARKNLLLYQQKFKVLHEQLKFSLPNTTKILEKIYKDFH